MDNINTAIDERIAQVLPFLEVAMRQAGQIMLDADRNPAMIDEKSGRANFVTTYDRNVQQFLKARFEEILPEAVFVGEEEDIHASIREGLAFIVDPIDGTTNFIKDYHVSCISAGITLDGAPFAGLVYNPYLNEMYKAQRGRGAFLNNTPIHVSGLPLSQGVALFGTSPYYPELTDRSFALAKAIFRESLDIRRSGSAAIDLCSVAAGRAELFFELILSPWDYAAGAIILTEAGGQITTVSDEPITLSSPCSIKATNGVADYELI